MESRSLVALDDLPAAIKKAHNAVIMQAKRSIHSAYECGLLLSQAKTQCRHGEFADWLSANVDGLSDSTVRLYMRIADGDNWLRIKEQIESGKIVTIREAQQICKREPKPEPESNYLVSLNSSGPEPKPESNLPESPDSSTPEPKRQQVAESEPDSGDDRQDEDVDPVADEIPPGRLHSLKVELEQKIWTWLQKKPAHVWQCAAGWLEDLAEEVRKS